MLTFMRRPLRRGLSVGEGCRGARVAAYSRKYGRWIYALSESGSEAEPRSMLPRWGRGSPSNRISSATSASVVATASHSSAQVGAVGVLPEPRIPAARAEEEEEGVGSAAVAVAPAASVVDVAVLEGLSTGGHGGYWFSGPHRWSVPLSVSGAAPWMGCRSWTSTSPGTGSFRPWGG